MAEFKKCKNCKHLDLEQKRGCGYVCTNKKRRTHWTTKDTGNIKTLGTPACKTGFEQK